MAKIAKTFGIFACFYCMNTILVWFRNDLRLLDHEALYKACQKSTQIIPVFCFDTRQIALTSHKFRKTDAIRWQFLIESVADLAKNIEAKGGKLHIATGKPEQVIAELAVKYKVSSVFYHKEVTAEETKVEVALEKNLAGSGIKTESFWGSTLYHLADLPFSVARMPDVFTNFRKACEITNRVRSTFSAPIKITVPADLPLSVVPSLASFGFEPIAAAEPKGVLHFLGGESHAEARLKHYFWEQNCLKDYKETRNGLLGADYSSKFSAWLALGCISPRRIYEEIKFYEQQRISNASTYWLIFELIWRDFFRFIALKNGNSLFFDGENRPHSKVIKQNNALFEAWKNGETGFPFIDANMQELNKTGFMSNRGRQNVASFLVHDLKCSWYAGAAYFESKLIDYDPCSNYGNWKYVAGVGNDPRENRYFNTIKQAKDYDPQANFTKYWLPELKNLPKNLAFEPFIATTKELAECGVVLGVSYPNPVIKLGRKTY